MKSINVSILRFYYLFCEWIFSVHLRFWRTGRLVQLRKQGLKCDINPFPTNATVINPKYMLMGGDLYRFLLCTRMS